MGPEPNWVAASASAGEPVPKAGQLSFDAFWGNRRRLTDGGLGEGDILGEQVSDNGYDGTGGEARAGAVDYDLMESFGVETALDRDLHCGPQSCQIVSAEKIVEELGQRRIAIPVEDDHLLHKGAPEKGHIFLAYRAGEHRRLDTHESRRFAATDRALENTHRRTGDISKASGDGRGHCREDEDGQPRASRRFGAGNYQAEAFAKLVLGAHDEHHALDRLPPQLIHSADYRTACEHAENDPPLFGHVDTDHVEAAHGEPASHGKAHVPQTDDDLHAIAHSLEQINRAGRDSPDLVEGDEFSMLPENAEEAGLSLPKPPTVERLHRGGISLIRWGNGPPQLVLLHGGAQNSHTWDTVALALQLPLLAIDLPGHGRSEWRSDHDYRPITLAAQVAPVIEELAPQARLIVGMSLGGLAAIVLAASRPEIVKRLTIVDVTPGTDAAKSRPILDMARGPAVFASFASLLDWTAQHNPKRSPASLRRGAIHNARQLSNGSWAWRYDPVRNWSEAGMVPNFADLWSYVDLIQCQMLLVLGSDSEAVDEADVAEMRRRQPGLDVEIVAGAGHNVQGDRPVELATLIAGFMGGGSSDV